MSSSTSLSDAPRRSWRRLSWIGWTCLGVVLIEAAIAFLSPTGEDARRNFLEYRFGHQESPDRLITADKMNVFAEDDPAILQVGDSSGFHGVQPPIIEERLGGRYLNMSVFGSQGYEGYYQVAKYMFERNSHIRYLVLYVTPAGQQPRPSTINSKDLFGDDIAREYNSAFHALFRLPSLGLRQRVTDLVYYGATDASKTAWLRQPTRYLEAPRLIRQSGGWTREEDNGASNCAPKAEAQDCTDIRESVVDWGRRILRKPDASDEAVVQELGQDYGVSPVVFDPSKLAYVNLADQVYDRFRTLAQANGARLIISGAPISEVFRAGGTAEKIAAFNETLNAYAQAHPEVSVIESVFWPDARFSSTVHVSTPYISENSRRLAAALSDIVSLPRRASPAALAASREKATEIDMSADHPPAYGLGPIVKIGEANMRGIRAGRYEALFFNRAPASSTMEIEIAPGTSPNVLRKLTITVNGEKAEPELSSSPEVLRWRLPPAASRFIGWMEILVSTRGRETWLDDSLTPDATGPQLRMKTLRFD